MRVPEPVVPEPVVPAPERRRQSVPWPRLRMLGTVGLLVVVATAVSLILAQSAGAIHLGFLGPVG
jgi:hypothetical protein